MLVGKLQDFQINDLIVFNNIPLRIVGSREDGKIGCQYPINPDCVIWHDPSKLAHRSLTIK